MATASTPIDPTAFAVPADFQTLFEQAKTLAGNVPCPATPCPGVLLFETDSGEIHAAHIENDGRDDAFLALIEDKILCRLVYMWQGGAIDVPSHAIRKRLCALHVKKRRGADAPVRCGSLSH